MNLKKYKVSSIPLLLISFLMVAFAQPDWSIASCLLASSLGYALFWKAMLAFSSKKGRFLLAFGWFSLLSIYHLNWFFADRYVGFYIYPFIFLLVVGLGVQFGLLSLFISVSKSFGIVEVLGISGGWVLCEWSRLHLLSGFSFDPIGLALSATSSGMQIASMIGIYGMSFWVILTNLLALRLWIERSWGNCIAWILIATTPYFFGYAQLTIHKQRMEKDQTAPLSVLLVQTALAPEQKQSVNGSSPYSLFQQWERALAMLAPYGNTFPELIVFSEGFVPYGTDTQIYPIHSVLESFGYFFKHNRCPCAHTHSHVGNRFWAQSIADVMGADVVIGLEDMSIKEERAQAYNAAFLFQPEEKEGGCYHKRILVPMGEYIPFNWCKKILSKYGILDSYTAGTESTIFQLARVPAALSICYEETYGNLMRESLIKGAHMHINLSNDVWYPRSRLPIVHFLHGRLRAVEGGIPQLRACNTGVTCGIDALGRVVDLLPYETAKREAAPGILALNLPLYHHTTFYSLYGDQPLIYFSSILFSWLCVVRYLQRKQFIVNGLDIYPLRKN